MEQHKLEDLNYHTANGVAWVTLNRPDTHNALSTRMRADLQTVWREVRRDDSVRCVVLTGSGDKAFCSGIDRSELSDEPGRFDPYSYDDLGAQIGPKSNGLWKPVIAAVNGMACGGAAYLLGESEFIIAAEHATFFDPHVTYGMPAVYEPILLSGRMSFGDLTRMSLLGASERMSATTAKGSGLVSEVVPADALPDAARWAAETIAAQPALPVQTTVRSLWAARRLGYQDALDMGNVLLAAGNDPDAFAAGQSDFRGRVRQEPRLR